MSPHLVAWSLVEPGWRVFDAAGHELGSVDEVLGDHDEDVFEGLSVLGGLGDRSHYVAADQIVSIASDGTIVVSLDRDGFDRLPDPGPAR
jgi:uncharacterized protein YrrD